MLLLMEVVHNIFSFMQHVLCVFSKSYMNIPLYSLTHGCHVAKPHVGYSSQSEGRYHRKMRHRLQLLSTIFFNARPITIPKMRHWHSWIECCLVYCIHSSGGSAVYRNSIFCSIIASCFPSIDIHSVQLDTLFSHVINELFNCTALVSSTINF